MATSLSFGASRRRLERKVERFDGVVPGELVYGQRGARVALRRIKRDGAPCAVRHLRGALGPVERGREGRRIEMRLGQRGPAFREIGIDPQRLFEPVDRLGDHRVADRPHRQGAALQIQRVGFAVGGHPSRGCRRRLDAQRRAQPGDEVISDDAGAIRSRPRPCRRIDRPRPRSRTGRRSAAG